jgi:hypothetical protein
MNSNFISLIPKKNKLETFEDYKTTSLCNVIYKVIENIITLILD